MCGIVGFISKSKNQLLLDNFIKEIEHRGPDETNNKIVNIRNKQVHFGSTRLSIRGGKSESMPMISENQNILVYNGEIFDMNLMYKNLSNKKVYTGDTRMILDLLDENKLFLEKVNGMFAFAYLDTKKGKLYLARDKFGIKPLFYTFNNKNELFFSSEMKSLLKISNCKSSISEEDLYKIYLFNGINKKYVFGNIFSVLPGELLTIDIETLDIESYSFNKLLDYEVDNDFESIFSQVIEDHLQADTSVDVLLSGGIDSSLITYFINKKLNKKVRHFSLSFDNKSYDESSNFYKIAETLNLESKVFQFETSKLDSYISEAIENMNTICLDYSFVPTYLLCKKTSKYTKAVLSGDGADELFGGYEWYRAMMYYRFLPYHLKKFISVTLNKISFETSSDQYLNFSRKLNLFFKYISRDKYVQTLIWQSPYNNFSEVEESYLVNELSDYINKSQSIQNNLRNIDLNNYLKTNVLNKVDSASMACSLEIRPPFLDERIVNFAFQTAKSNSVSLQNSKVFLRNILHETELNFLLKNKKHGFAFPLNNWLISEGLEKIKELFFQESLFYLSKDKIRIEKLLNKKSFNINEERELWAYFVSSSWFQKNNVKQNF